MLKPVPNRLEGHVMSATIIHFPSSRHADAPAVPSPRSPEPSALDRQAAEIFAAHIPDLIPFIPADRPLGARIAAAASELAVR